MPVSSLLLETPECSIGKQRAVAEIHGGKLYRSIGYVSHHTTLEVEEAWADFLSAAGLRLSEANNTKTGVGAKTLGQWLGDRGIVAVEPIRDAPKIYLDFID